MEQEIKVGDRVVGVGVVSGNDINGKTGTVMQVGVLLAIKFDENINGWKDESIGIEKGHGWYCRPGNLRRIPDEPSTPSPAWSIHITPRGNATHAVLKQGKRIRAHTFAHCNPRDTYDATTGAAWAFLRLPGMADTARRVLAEMDGAKVPTQEPKRRLTLEECKPGLKVRFICEYAHNNALRKYPCVGTIGEIVINPFKDGTVYVQWPDGSTCADDRWWVKPEMIERAVVADLADEHTPVSQPTYKPGDRVKIVDEPADGSCIVSSMYRWLGNEMTIYNVFSGDSENPLYTMEEDYHIYVWGQVDIVGKVGESRKEK